MKLMMVLFFIRLLDKGPYFLRPYVPILPQAQQLINAQLAFPHLCHLMQQITIHNGLLGKRKIRIDFVQI